MEKHVVRRVCLGVVLLLLASGCAGIVNPHVKWDPPEGKIPDATALTLDYAIKYAYSARAAYKNALGNQSQLASWLGIGLIPISAAALGLGITGKSPGAITALGLTGASGYAVGTWLYSKPNQRAWVVGYNATTCAVDAILPLLYVQKNENEIKPAVMTLDSAVVSVEAGIGDVRKQLLLIGDKPPSDLVDLKEFAEQRVNEAEKLLAAAYDTRGKAEKMRQEAAIAGVSLKETVDRISGQVSAQIVETGPDIQAMAFLIGGLAQSYGQFVRVPEGLRPAPPPSPKGEADVTNKKVKEHLVKQDKGLRDALGDLQTKMLSLQGAASRVAEIVNGITATKPIEKLRACGVTPEQIAQPITVEPPGRIELQAGKAAMVGRVIRGGSAPYAVVLQGDAEGPMVRQTEPFGPAFTVQITEKTPAKEYSLYISDKAGQRLFIPVDVKSRTADQTSSEGTPFSKAADEINRLKPSFELKNPDVNVRIIKAEVVSGNLDVEVEIKAKSGPTTQAILDKIMDDQLKNEILKLQPLKDYGIDKKEKINVKKTMAST